MIRTMMGARCTKSLKVMAGNLQRTGLFLAVAFTLALAACPAMYGQATGSFSGNIADKSGSAIPGATVTATSQSTGLVRSGKADEAGHYLIPLLPAAIYTLHVDFIGFQ